MADYKPRGGYRGRGHHQSHYRAAPQYQAAQPQAYAPPAAPQWAPQQAQQFAPPAQPQYMQAAAPPAAAPQAPPAEQQQQVPKIFVRSEENCDAYLDLRVILPSDRYPNINWGGRIIGHKGKTIREIQSEYNIKLMINTDGQMSKDNTFNPATDPPHVRIQGSGPLGDVLRRMAGVADELAKRFNPYWKDEAYDEQKAAADNDEEAKSGDEDGSDDGDKKPAATGGFRGRGRGRGGFRGRGRGDFRGGARGGYRGRGNFTPRGRGGHQGQTFGGGAMRPSYHQSHAPGPY